MAGVCEVYCSISRDLDAVGAPGSLILPRCAASPHHFSAAESRLSHALPAQLSLPGHQLSHCLGPLSGQMALAAAPLLQQHLQNGPSILARQGILDRSPSLQPEAQSARCFQIFLLRITTCQMTH